MGAFRQFWKQPQRVWLRRALFQIHLWSGIGIGLYVLVISISGSVVVFRQDVFRAYESPVIHVDEEGQRLDAEGIKAAATRVYPGYEVTQLYEVEDDPRRAVEVRLEKGRSIRNRLFDPYTGADLGRSVPWQISAMAWFYDLHVELFGGRLGRQINAVGGVLWTVLALTGIIVWWQGIQNWKRGLLVRLKSGWRRFNWDL
ncbi:MAG TPA: PepSY domain-containing protein, partial [Terriglobia bacterium]|nr:PepSY domain-containing protein [Terriglobia bacterium]